MRARLRANPLSLRSAGCRVGGMRHLLLPGTALLLAALTLAGCASTRSASQTSAVPAASGSAVARYMPLAVGNHWTYVVRTDRMNAIRTVRILERRGGFYRDDQGGAFAFDGEGLRDERRYLILAPLAEGHRWESLLEGGRRERYEIVETDGRVTVPAGTFEEVLVVRATSPQGDGTTLEVEWSWAPGVGLIRLRSTAILAGGERVPQAEFELSDYRVAG